MRKTFEMMDARVHRHIRHNFRLSIEYFSPRNLLLLIENFKVTVVEVNDNT